MLKCSRYEKPWLEDPRWTRPKRINSAIMLTGFIIGLVLIFFYLWDGYWVATPIGEQYCLIMDDQFDAIGRDNWSYEIQTGRFGNGEFSWTTDDSQNVFVDAEGLHIVPTLTTDSTDITEAQLLDGYTLNLTTAGSDGTCTSTDVKMCSIKSNVTLGHILPPARSARITTKGKKSIRYGRVEVVAKMPRGDWLWPAIWMMPEDSVYGVWPASGEIDIAETRGNNYTYPRGRNVITSALHWGPDPQHDGYMTTYDTFFFKSNRLDFTDRFFTFGLEWTTDYIFMYVDNRLYRVFDLRFKGKEPFWEKGKFQGTSNSNGQLYTNPWLEAGNPIAPFDQKFYLSLKVAVGAQNGWFYNGKYNKPWVDGSASAARDFWNAKEQWLPTWGEGNDRGMTVKSVKMWQWC
ncbi:glycoside hydrolase family 16 protein [Macroventuria anomochaeta]|uniref:Glycoside hydrolase family 16 protein n=1 Tax=Macroventuria anomochaeta TaxID=301207 RepID=A0ACB6RZY7_9PLEO|nr:glycoside hydrolase family 16 protein [Macroventuria anomochaeta]KAF2627591.1 glycoside hydrolase family 16 protein [Macroventuria anomochaeta]